MPGDRKSTCGGRMKPIGLTYKQDGELMIVHLCLSCKAISCNRIAGDDNPYIVTCLLDVLYNIDSNTHTRLTQYHKTLLTQEDRQNVLHSLYGNNYTDNSIKL